MRISLILVSRKSFNTAFPKEPVPQVISSVFPENIDYSLFELVIDYRIGSISEQVWTHLLLFLVVMRSKPRATYRGRNTLIFRGRGYVVELSAMRTAKKYTNLNIFSLLSPSQGFHPMNVQYLNILGIVSTGCK
jgi:hypothetical protein